MLLINLVLLKNEKGIYNSFRTVAKNVVYHELHKGLKAMERAFQIAVFI